jgi:hypothetical protein
MSPQVVELGTRTEWLLGQFPQLTLECLAEEPGKDEMSLPSEEMDKLTQGEEEEGDRLEGWRTVKEVNHLDVEVGEEEP